MSEPASPTFDRRRFLAALGLAGAAPELLLGAEAARPITKETVAQAEKLAGLELSDADRELMLKGLEELRADYEKIRQVPLPNQVVPAFRFDPAPPGMASVSLAADAAETRARLSEPPFPPLPPEVPADLEALAFWPVTHLARLVRDREVTSTDLTRMYLARLRRLDPTLLAVISYTEERALARAERADREIAGGRWRGPLHGIPWGAKDLLAVAGYPTTWGAGPYKEQRIEEDATVVTRLDEAGAVLVAKTTLGELAWGDVWYGGTTKNPWKTDQGSSGSSAGSAAATAAGALGFSLGSETLGSIVSPATRTGATGLRPTFGRVSRHGAMTLSWTFDKLGPICRSVEDCALVLAAIQGPDGKDWTVVDRPFEWDPRLDVKRLRVGYVKAAFEEAPAEGQEEWHRHDLEALAAVKALGVELLPVELPKLPVDALSFLLTVEAAAAFDELTRSGKDDQLVRQVEQAWPNVFRQARTIPAVEYVQAQRVRMLLMREMDRIMAGLDAYVGPTYGGSNLLLTNLTGHPQVTVPNGFRKDGTPTSITFTGRLYGENEMLALAKAYQDATRWHLRRPEIGAAPATG